MLWIIFTLWLLFSITLAIIELKTNSHICVFIFIVSVVVMFYIPFMV